jgi:hypothetical protein
MEHITLVEFALPAWPDAGELDRVRAELEHLVRYRFCHGLAADDFARYQELTQQEERLLGVLAQLTN